MTARFAGPLIGGPCAGRWAESPGPVVEVIQTTSVPLPSGPWDWPADVQQKEVELRSHTYIFERWPAPNGGEIGAFRHESLTTRADMLRELLIHYRPMAKNRS